MATPLAMPRQGQSVESCTIQEWTKKRGDSVIEGELLYTYETDKASFEFIAPVSGVLLEIFFNAGDDVPVLTNVGVIGNAGENIDAFRPAASSSSSNAPSVSAPSVASVETPLSITSVPAIVASPVESMLKISPRAQALAAKTSVDIAHVSGTGPMGRIIERDVQLALKDGVRLTPVAQAKAVASGLTAPVKGSGIGGRIRAEDLVAAPEVAALAAGISHEFTDTKITGMRKIIAERMVQSLATGAQLTMSASARAEGLLAYRAKVKVQAETLGLANITIGDLVALALARTLVRFPELNALCMDSTIRQYAHVHVGIAVDTPRGLMVPVVKYADCLSLNELAKTIKILGKQCVDGAINPDHLAGGTFTISNLGAFGIEHFTPVLNAPQVALLGVCAITPKAVEKNDGTYELAPCIGLSLTIDHRAVDGAPAARFLKALVCAIENIELVLAM